MAQTINLLGEWSSVPGVNLPKAGGGTAYFADPTITTATEGDVAQGKTFLKADGSIGTGTNTGGGGGTISLQAKTKSYTPTETAQSDAVTADSGYDGLSQVTVNVGAISTTYVGSGITRRSSSDLSASGATVSVPAGYYASAASKAVASGSATTPATTITANPSVSIDSDGLITATASAAKSVTPTVSAGYVSSGTGGTITVTGTGTLQLTKRTSSDLTVSGATVTAPAGYYPAAAQKSIPTGSATTPQTTITANPTISVDPDTGEVTAAVSASQSITPTVSAGYISAGSAGTVNVSGSATEQLAVLDETDITATITDRSGQFSLRTNAVTVPQGWSSGIMLTPAFAEMVIGAMNGMGIDANGDVTVNFSPQTAGMAYTSKNYQLTGNMSVQAGTTITPSTSQQVAIAADTYATGAVLVDPIPSQYIVPTGSQTITANGTVDVTALAEVIVNVAGSGGLEYETGTWTPDSDIARGAVSFANTHTEAPALILLADTTGTSDTTTNTGMVYAYVDPEKLWGNGFPYSSSAFRYVVNYYTYRGNSTTSLSSSALICSHTSSETNNAANLYPRYWATETGFQPYTNSTSRYWRSGRTYSWIAIWKP